MAECRKSYGVLLFLLNSMSKRMQSREELLAEIDTLDLPEQTLEMFRRVVNTVEEDLTPDQWREYELDLNKYQRTMGMIRTGRIEGREEGREEGRKEGREEGRKQGREEGREEEKRIIARSMKENGLDIALIARCTGLLPEEIEVL